MKHLGAIFSAIFTHFPYLYLVVLIVVVSPFYAHADPLTDATPRKIQVKKTGPLLYYATLEGEVLLAVSQRSTIMSHAQAEIKNAAVRMSHNDKADTPLLVGYEYGAVAPMNKTVDGKGEVSNQTNDDNQDADETATLNPPRFTTNRLALHQNFGSNGDTLYKSRQGKLVLRKRVSGGITFYSPEFDKGIAVLQSRFKPTPNYQEEYEIEGETKAVMAVKTEKSVQDWAARYPYSGSRERDENPL